MADRLYRQLAIVVILALVLALAGFGSAAAQTPPGASQGVGQDAAEFAPGEVLVKFVPGTPGQAVADLHRQLGGQVKQTISGIEVQVVAVPVGQEKARAALYTHNPNVQYAEVNGILRAVGAPNDYYAGQQWQYNNTGQSGGTADADVDAFEAWDIQLGSGVRVAVLDTGVNRTHPDLLGKVVAWKNFTTSPSADDLHGHGTHTAGSVGAQTNNSIGVAGTCPDCSIMNLKVLGDGGTGSLSWIADAIVAATNGFSTDGKGQPAWSPPAKVISLSLGAGSGYYTLENAVNYAWNNNALVVAAAGNDNTTSLFYPAAYPNAIAVGATDNKDAKASFSNYGASWVDIAAPGVDILSTYHNSTYPNTYAWMSGTSMSTPHVAGVAGLVWATGKYTTAAQVRAAIEQNTDTIAGIGTYWSHGRLNAYKAVGGAITPPANQPPVASFTYGCTGLTCSFNGLASSDPGGSIASYVWTFGDGTSGTGATPGHTYASAGTRTVTLTVTDNQGATGATSKSVTVTDPGVATKMHVSAISGTSKDVKRPTKTWTATAKVTVVNGNGQVVSGATVTGDWSGAKTAPGVTSTTDASGVATFTTPPPAMTGNSGTVTFTVKGISNGDWIYDSGANVRNYVTIVNR